MTSGRTPRLRAPALTITILFAAVVLGLALLGSLALADDSTTLPPEVTAEETEATQPVSPSATASTSLRAHQPGDAVDGSKATHWAAISLNYPQWLTVDLGAPQRVVKSSISWLRLEKSRKYFYRLEGSLDGEEWQLLADRSRKSAFNGTNDTLDVEVQYLRVTVLGANRGRAGIKEIKVKKDTTASDEWVVVTPTPEPSPEPSDPGDEWAVVTPTPTPTPTDTATGVSISSISASHAPVGASITISGAGFGSTQGTSTVTFGERLVTTPSPTGDRSWAPCAKKATVQAWTDTTIRVTVPSMSPGKPGEPGTYHPLYVTVDGKMSNSHDFYIDPVTTVTNRVFSTTSSMGNVIGRDGGSNSRLDTYGTHDVLFENCTFEATNQYIDGNAYGVLTIGLNPTQAPTNRNLTFLNCTFKRNLGPGNLNAGWRGVNLVKTIYGVHDVTFEGCAFEECSRMSMEVWSDHDPARTPYNFAVMNSTFEPAGNQCLSWSGGDTLPIYSIADGCLFKGYGNNVTYYPSGSAAWESNGSTHIVTRNCEFWAGYAGPINVSAYNGSGPSYLYFENVDILFDSAHYYQSRAPNPGGAVLLECKNMHYSRWKDCDIITGDSRLYAWGAGYSGESGAPSWWGANYYNDFSGSTITGYVRIASPYPGVPATAAGYWDSDPRVPSSNILPLKK